MSDPTYRIEVSHHPGEEWPFQANVFRESDGKWMGVKIGTTAAEALDTGQNLVRDLNTQQEPFAVYVDDDGRPVEGHSVKA